MDDDLRNVFALTSALEHAGAAHLPVAEDLRGRLCQRQEVCSLIETDRHFAYSSEPLVSFARASAARDPA